MDAAMLDHVSLDFNPDRNEAKSVCVLGIWKEKTLGNHWHSNRRKFNLLHIMCGYQCDKAVTKMIPVK